MLIAFNLSLHYSKEEVLRTYLNQVEFLNGIRGYKSACESYFGKPCAALFPSELSFLIATAQLGKNPLQEKGFATIKKKAEQLCIHAFGSEQCKDWEQLPPLANSELKLPPNSLLPQLSEYQAGTEEKDQISAFDLQLYEQINQLLDRSKDYRKQLAIEDCCVIVLNKAGQILSMNTCRPFDEEEQGQVNGCLRKRQT